MKLGTREKGLLGLTTLVVLLFAMDRFVVAPISGMLADMDRRILAEEIRLRKGMYVLSNKDRFQKELGTRARPADENAGDILTLLKEIEGFARTSGVKIKDMRPSRAGRTRSQSISVTLEASWGSLVKFLDKVENGPYGLQVGKAHFFASGDGGDLRAQVDVIL